MSPILGGGSGGAGGGLSAIFDSTLGSDTASLDTGAAGIGAGHKDLIVLLFIRATDAATTVNLKLNANNDAGANYDWSLVRNDGTNAANGASAVSATAAVVGQVTAANATANVAGAVTIFIPAYDSTTFFKAGTGTCGPTPTTASTQEAMAVHFTWLSTAAITRLAVASASGGNLKTGSRMVIYGTA